MSRSLIIFDPICGTTFHLPDDDIYYTKLLSREFDKVRIVSSPYVIDALHKEELPNVKLERTRFHKNFVKLKSEGVLYILRMIFSSKMDSRAIVFLPVFYELALILFKRFRAKTTPVYAILHNNFANTRGPGVKKWLKRHLFKKALSALNGLFVFSNDAKQELINCIGDIDSKVHVIPLYMAGKKLDIPVQRPLNTLLFFGIGRSEKGQEKFHALINYAPFRHFKVIVSGSKLPLEDIREIKLKIDDFHYTQGYISNEAFYNQLRECSFLCLPYEISYKGKLSGMFCDAISSGTPVIVPNFAPFSSYFAQFGDLGILINFDDQNWCAELETKLKSFDYIQFYENSRRAREYHSKENIANKIMDVLGRPTQI